MARTKKEFKWAHILTGGAAGALDAINGNNLIDLDAHIVMNQSGGFLYSLDDDSGASESSPSTIAPDVNAGNIRHLLQGLTFPNTGLKILETSGADTLTLKWNETDSADRILSLLLHGANRTLDLYENLKVDDGYNIILQALGQANSLILNESLTIGNGNSGTITFTAASKTVTVAGSCTLNDWFDQAVKVASSPTHVDLTLTGSLTTKGFKPTLVTKTGNYTATATDYTIICNASGGSFTITLPAAASHTDRVYNIKKIDSSANTITVDGNSSETIDDSTTAILTTQYESITIQSDGSEWWII